MVESSTAAQPILLVDDDPDDIQVMQRAFRERGIDQPMEVANDGQELLDRLRDPESEVPAFVVLDISMPGMSGLEALEHMKADPRFRSIPVVMLTTSSTGPDVRRAFDLGVATYIAKPSDYGGYLRAADQVGAMLAKLRAANGGSRA